MLSPALPLKDALRGLRTGLATGRNTIRPLRETMPQPIRGLFGDILSQVDSIGLKVEKATSGLLRSLLDQPGRDNRGWTLGQMAADPAGDEIFAERLYQGLHIAFERLSLSGELLSEVMAARTFDQTRNASPPPGDTCDLAAALLLQADARMFAYPPPFTARAPAEDRRLALFAVMLWLLVERDATTDESVLLQVCIDAASALGRQISDLPDGRDEIRRLLSDYSRLI